MNHWHLILFLSEMKRSWPSIPMDSASVASTNCGSKISKTIPESSKKQNLNLPHPNNYLHIIYIVLGIFSSLEMI